MNIEELKDQYLIDIDIQEEHIEKQSLSLPKVMAKYQFFYQDTLSIIANLNDNLERLYYESVMQYKEGQGDLGRFTLNSTELKKLIESSVVYRETKKKVLLKEVELKLVEDMLSNLRGISYNVGNVLTYRKIMLGV